MGKHFPSADPIQKPLELQIDGHRLAALPVDRGAADVPVFFLHGIGGSIYFWTPELTSSFHRTGPCYSLSLPGHFPASFPRDFRAVSLTAELIAHLITGVIEAIVGNRRVLLVGHSTGGFAALCAGIYCPQRVAGIVSIGGFSRGRWTGALGFGQWLVRRGPIGSAIFKSVYRLGGSSPALFLMYWHAYVHDHGTLVRSRPLVHVIDRMLPHFRKLDLNSLAQYFASMPDTDISPQLSKITAPTCLIAGDKDPIVPYQQSVAIAAKLECAKLAIIQDAGHLPFFEKPVEYERALTDWLGEFRD